jgi:hypothetical protein
MKVDAESKKYLEEVKKGKPRKFVMICKGVKILNLIVYKIGSEAKYKNLIKKADGAGQFYGGVVSGKAKNIVFELSSEQYDRPPGKDHLLKQFLEEEAGMSFKPVYAIVETLTSVDDSTANAEQPVDDVDPIGTKVTSDVDETNEVASEETTPKTPDLRDGNVHPDQREVPVTSSATESPSKQQTKDQKIASQLSDALENLRPKFEQVIEMYPDAEDDLVNKMGEIVDQIRQQQFREARRNIGDFGHALEGLQALPTRDGNA